MTPLSYIIIGVVGGALIGLVVGTPLRNRNRGGITLANARTLEEEVVRRLEAIDRVLRDEFSRNREVAGTAAKSQREELGKSLEGVRGIVDLRLKEFQQDNG